MTRSTGTPTDAQEHIGEAKRTLRKLDALWDELWSQQFDPPPRRENDEIVERVHTGPPGSRMLHTGQPGELERYYLDVQQALRKAWLTCGGTWHTDYSGTLPPVAMRRIGRLLADMLDDPNLSDRVAVKACEQIMGGWWSLPDGIRGEPHGGARRCTHCTDPAEKGKRQCNRHAHVKRVCERDGCGKELRQTDGKVCAACRKRDQRQRGAA